MTRDLRSAARYLVLPTLALAIVLAFLPGRLGLAVRVYALLLCAVALVIALAALRRALPPEKPLVSHRSRPSRGARPPSLARLESEASLGVATAFDLHRRLRPHLRALAAGLLSSRRRVSLDADPDGSRRILGDETWELVRKGRPSPEDRMGRGLTPSALADVVDSLERV